MVRSLGNAAEASAPRGSQQIPPLSPSLIILRTATTRQSPIRVHAGSRRCARHRACRHGSATAERGIFSPRECSRRGRFTGIRHEFLGRVLGQAVGGKLPADGEQSAIMVVQQVGSELGLKDSRRLAIIGRVRELARDPAPSDLLGMWVSLVGQIGGPAETQLLLELEGLGDSNKSGRSQESG